MASTERRPIGVAAELYRYSGLGLSFAATIGVFAAVGYWIDTQLGSGPWLLLVGVFLGFALGLTSMLKKLPARTAEESHAPASDSPDDDSPDDPTR
jgi:ATP synthase protein I